MPSDRIEPLSNSPRIDTGRESGQILCHAFGLDPRDVHAITIYWRAGDIPYAEVEMFLNERVVFEIIQLRPERITADG